MGYSLWKFLAGLICALSFLMLVTAGCRRGTPGLVGIWNNNKVPEMVEFKSDGSGIFSYQGNSNPPLKFVWKKKGEHTYLLNIDYLGSRKELLATVQNTSLVVESTTGKEFYSKREPR